MGTKVQPIKKVLNESIEANVINEDIVQNFNNFDRVALTRFRMAHLGWLVHFMDRKRVCTAKFKYLYSDS